jgi:hypothetical protein
VSARTADVNLSLIACGRNSVLSNANRSGIRIGIEPRRLRKSVRPDYSMATETVERRRNGRRQAKSWLVLSKNARTDGEENIGEG